MQVDLFLGIGALVVGDINRACQFDEAFAKALAALLVTNIILDFPQRLVY